MSVDICGFLEISALDAEDLQQDYAWRACIDLSSLDLLTGDICSILFGESKASLQATQLSEPWQPVAHRRGLPANASYQAKQAYQEVTAVVQQEHSMSLWGVTYVLDSEIENIDWLAYVGADLENLREPYSWGLLFKLFNAFDDRYHKRLVVWFECR